MDAKALSLSTSPEHSVARRRCGGRPPAVRPLAVRAPDVRAPGAGRAAAQPGRRAGGGRTEYRARDRRRHRPGRWRTGSGCSAISAISAAMSRPQAGAACSRPSRTLAEATEGRGWARDMVVRLCLDARRPGRRAVHARRRARKLSHARRSSRRGAGVRRDARRRRPAPGASPTAGASAAHRQCRLRRAGDRFAPATAAHHGERRHRGARRADPPRHGGHRRARSPDRRARRFRRVGRRQPGPPGGARRRGLLLSPLRRGAESNISARAASASGRPLLRLRQHQDDRDRAEWALLSARWMSGACHRSLYGHQLRAALALAIENPHIAVTFLPLACTGATIDVGLLTGQRSRELTCGSGVPLPAHNACPGGAAARPPRPRPQRTQPDRSARSRVPDDRRKRHRLPRPRRRHHHRARRASAASFAAPASSSTRRGLAGDARRASCPATSPSCAPRSRRSSTTLRARRLRVLRQSRARAGRQSLPGRPRSGFDINPTFGVGADRLARATAFVQQKFLPALKDIATCKASGACASPSETHDLRRRAPGGLRRARLLRPGRQRSAVRPRMLPRRTARASSESLVDGANQPLACGAGGERIPRLCAARALDQDRERQLLRRHDLSRRRLRRRCSRATCTTRPGAFSRRSMAAPFTRPPRATPRWPMPRSKAPAARCTSCRPGRHRAAAAAAAVTLHDV